MRIQRLQQADMKSVINREARTTWSRPPSLLCLAHVNYRILRTSPSHRCWCGTRRRECHPFCLHLELQACLASCIFKASEVLHHLMMHVRRSCCLLHVVQRECIRLYQQSTWRYCISAWCSLLQRHLRVDLSWQRGPRDYVGCLSLHAIKFLMQRL